LNGYGSVTFPDGIELSGEWKDHVPQFDHRHPLIKDCLQRGLCTRHLSGIPQLFGMFRPPNMITVMYCEYCFSTCQQANLEHIKWMWDDNSMWECACSCVYVLV
jgi:hypothetical protein